MEGFDWLTLSLALSQRERELKAGGQTVANLQYEARYHMVQDPKQRQKKLEKKAKKRKLALAKKSSNPMLSKNKAASHANYPIHECLVPSSLFETGLGTVIVSRRSPQGIIAVSAFIVDVFCLGVKNALFEVADEYKYAKTIRPGLTIGHEGRSFDNVDPACARKLIEGAIAYAGELGFSPHPDCRNAIRIFGSIDPSACPMQFTYGKDGKPFYISGPHESPEAVRKIIGQLEMKCGRDGYHILVGVDDAFE